MSKKSKEWTVEKVVASVKRNFGVSFIGKNQINFNPTGGVGIKTLGKLDYLATQGYSVKAVIPEKNTRRRR